MLPMILSSLVTASLSIVSTLATKAFFEAVLTKVIIYAAERLSAMSTNTLDDALVADIKARLGAFNVNK